MSDPTAPVEGTSTEAPAEAAPTAEPWAGVMDRVSELASNIDTRFGQLEQRIPAPEPEAEPDPWASLFPEQAEPEYEQEPQGLDPQALQAAFQQAVQQATGPMQQQLQAMQWERDRQQLLSEVPQLKDPEVAQQTIQGFNAFLQQTGTPPEVAQWLSNSPQMIGQFFKAAEAEKLAKGQAPASEQVPSLESAGGAVPGGNGEKPNYVQSAHNGAWQLPPGLR
jgi:hypothetical protein